MQNLSTRHERNLSKNKGTKKISLYSCLVNAMQSKITSNSKSFPECDAIRSVEIYRRFGGCVLLPSSGHKSSRHSFKMFNVLKKENKNGHILHRSEFL